MADISSNSQRSLRLEDALQYVGGYGRFQHLLIISIYIIILPAALQIMIVYFSAHEPTWKCAVNSTICILNGTLHPNDHRKCRMPRTDWYYTEPKEYSLVTEFDFSCSDEWLLLFIPSIYFVVWGIGAIVLGLAADKVGRKKICFASYILTLLIGIIRPFLPNIYLIFACRGLLGFFLPGVFVQGFLLTSELLGKQHRFVAGFLPSIFPASNCLLALLAYYVRRWKYLYLITTAPFIPELFFFKFVPESLLWLETNSNQIEIISILNRIAYWNKRSFQSDIIILPRKLIVGRNTHKGLFKRPKVLFQTFALSILWLAMFTVLYGLQFASNDLGGYFYRDFAILSFAGVPGLILGAYACRKIAKKKLVLVSSIGVVLSCLIIAFVHPAGDMKEIKITFGFVGQFLNGIPLTVMQVWSAELYPVCVRGYVMGVFNLASRIGATSAPWVIGSLLSHSYWLPFVVIVIPTAIGTVVGVWIPEKGVIASDDHGNQNNKTDNDNSSA